jgi:hypothetical protein
MPVLNIQNNRSHALVVGHGPARCASGPACVGNSSAPSWGKQPGAGTSRRGSVVAGGRTGGAGRWTGGGAGESGSMAAAVSAGDRGSGAVFPAGQNETTCSRLIT